MKNDVFRAVKKKHTLLFLTRRTYFSLYLQLSQLTFTFSKSTKETLKEV